MQGDPTVIMHLNAVLKNEMTAINQYFLHARMLEHWGVAKLGAHEYDESIDEMKHADMLIKRILFLGGEPRLELEKLLIGQTVPEVLECDEEHVDFLETQLELIGKIGLENYIQLQSQAAS